MYITGQHHPVLYNATQLPWSNTKYIGIGCGCFLSTLKIVLAFSFGKGRGKWGENNSRRWTSPFLQIAYIVYTMYSGFRMLWAEVGCVASDGIFFALSIGYL